MEYSIVLVWRIGKWATRCRCRVEQVEEEARRREHSWAIYKCEYGGWGGSSRRTGAVA